MVIIELIKEFKKGVGFQNARNRLLEAGITRNGKQKKKKKKIKSKAGAHLEGNKVGSRC